MSAKQIETDGEAGTQGIDCTRLIQGLYNNQLQTMHGGAQGWCPLELLLHSQIQSSINHKASENHQGFVARSPKMNASPGMIPYP